MTTSFFFRNHFLMHSRFELFVPLAESEKLNSLFNEIVLSVESLEKKISRYNESSQTSFLNQNASISPVKVDEDLFTLIEECMEFNKRTFGCFDITAQNGSGSSLNNIKANNLDNTISFESDNVSIDFGAIGKGLALEMAVELLDTSGIKNALINFGDSSVYGIGNHPKGNGWPVSISNTGKNIHINLNNNGFSSSGLHQSDSSKMAHIINPLTGELTRRDEKVIVLSKSPVLAEVLSTALYVADELTREAIKKEFPNEEIYTI